MKIISLIIISIAFILSVFLVELFWQVCPLSLHNICHQNGDFDIFLDSLNGQSIFYITAAFSTTIAIVLCAFIQKVSITSIFGLHRFNLNSLKIPLVFYFIYLLSLIILMFFNYYPKPSNFEQISGSNNILYFFTIAFIGPVFEELFFRGYIYHQLTKATIKIRVLVISLLFSVIHIPESTIMFILLFFLGIILGGARAASGSTFLPILIHMINNIIFGIWLIFIGM